MADETDRRDDQHDSLAERVPEIHELRVEPHPDLAGRVARDINRRTLAADGLDFCLTVMLETFWEYLRGVVDVWPGKPTRSDDTDRSD